MSVAALRVAVRKFAPFETALEKIWQSFQATIGCPLRLEAEALDLNPLYESLLTRQGLRDGTWDIAFLSTDWLAEAVEDGALLDLAPSMRQDPVPYYPHGWVPALLRYQQWGEAVYALP